MDRVEYQSLIIQDIINLEKRQELDTNPWYQRRSVWTSPQKSYLINTLFEKKPIPSIYIRHILNMDKGLSIKEIVDGQQRVKAIISYCNLEFSARHPAHNSPVKLNELSKSQRQSFLLSAVPVGYLLGANDSDVIDIFARINSVSKTLNFQEKRNALFSGEFKQFCTKEAVIRTEFWKDYNVFSANDIARMNEVQFISDLTINLINGITDFSQSKLNVFYKANDDVFKNQSNLRKRIEVVFDKLVSISPDTLKDSIFIRQPIFFSLFLAIDAKNSVSNAKLERAISEIDNRFNSDKPMAERPKEDVAFYNACSASTQRLANRKIRNNYISKFLS